MPPTCHYDAFHISNNALFLYNTVVLSFYTDAVLTFSSNVFSWIYTILDSSTMEWFQALKIGGGKITSSDDYMREGAPILLQI